MKRQDHTGVRYGRLTGVRLESVRARGIAYWVFRCDCGNEIVRPAAKVKYGHLTSCGCLARDALVERNTKRGGRDTPEYRIWMGMMTRCYNPKRRGYPNYGGRGITVCDRWHDFANFRSDMGPRPSPQHSIDRRDNDGPYAPYNCRWATDKEQGNHSRHCRYVTVDGVTDTLTRTAERVGITIRSLRKRMGRQPGAAVQEVIDRWRAKGHG